MHKISFQEETKISSFKRAILIIVFVLGLIYILLPGPSSVFDFPPLPNSIKSDLDGDTWQNPNIAAYFSDFRREEITKFYKSFFSRSIFLGIPLPIISLNRPPEEAYKYVRDQQESTFLEEYVFPLRGSIFVNGYEPRVENDMRGRQESDDYIGHFVKYNDKLYVSKTTLRFYPNNVFARVTTYLGIWLALIWFYKVTIKLNK